MVIKLEFNAPACNSTAEISDLLISEPDYAVLKDSEEEGAPGQIVVSVLEPLTQFIEISFIGTLTQEKTVYTNTVSILITILKASKEDKV